MRAAFERAHSCHETKPGPCLGARRARRSPASLLLGAPPARAQDEPRLVPELADYKKLLPLLPEPPAGWKAEPAEGSTDNLGETQITTVHRDYVKGEGDNAPITSISILDSVANPEYVEATTSAWNTNTSDAEGYTKSITVAEMPGFETYENDDQHGTLWLMIAKRYILQIETTGQPAPELQEWLKRIDLKKLAEIK